MLGESVGGDPVGLHEIQERLQTELARELEERQRLLDLVGVLPDPHEVKPGGRGVSEMCLGPDPRDEERPDAPT